MHRVGIRLDSTNHGSRAYRHKPLQYVQLRGDSNFFAKQVGVKSGKQSLKKTRVDCVMGAHCLRVHADKGMEKWHRQEICKRRERGVRVQVKEKTPSKVTHPLNVPDVRTIAAIGLEEVAKLAMKWLSASEKGKRREGSLQINFDVVDGVLASYSKRGAPVLFSFCQDLHVNAFSSGAEDAEQFGVDQETV